LQGPSIETMGVALGEGVGRFWTNLVGRLANLS
jgi:hypothetical protein